METEYRFTPMKKYGIVLVEDAQDDRSHMRRFLDRIQGKKPGGPQKSEAYKLRLKIAELEKKVFDLTLTNVAIRDLLNKTEENAILIAEDNKRLRRSNAQLRRNQ